MHTNALEKVVADLGKGPFAFGQLYTALSRVRRYNDLIIVGNDLDQSWKLSTKRTVNFWRGQKWLQLDNSPRA